MSAITTHVLDTSRGRPAVGVPLTLEFKLTENWKPIGKGATDADGRCKNLFSPETEFEAGTYRLTFDTGAYFQSLNVEGFYPEVIILFSIRDPRQHYHVPLLLSQFGYSTY